MSNCRRLVISFLPLFVALLPCGMSGTQNQPLRASAEQRGFFIGAAVAVSPFRNEPIYRETLGREFNIIVAENAFKWDSVRPSRTTFNFRDTDALVDFAQASNMKIRGHTLVWHNQIPGWLTNGNFSRDEVIAILREHILTFVGRYKGRVWAWDVVNEAVDDSTGGLRTGSFWYQKIGPDYLRLAFEFAREADPGAKLYYNDYSSEGLNTKSNGVFNLVSSLKSQGIPIDGVGWQMHQVNGFRMQPANRTNAKRLAELGLEISITEMDVRINLPTTPEKLAEQAQAYRDAINFCLTEPNCKALLMWGFTDKYSWIPAFFSGFGDALIYDMSYQPKPAYFALKEVLEQGRQQRSPANYDESKVGAYTLPDPLILNDGKPVRTATDWTKRRRPEILELFEAKVYGRSPQPPKDISYEVFDLDEHVLDGKAIRKQVTIHLSPKKDGPKEDLLMYLPTGSRKPVPMILSLNFSGNQAATADPRIKLATVWNPRTHEKQQASEQSRGRAQDPIEKILARGYAFGTICYQDIEPDFKGGYVHGIRPPLFKPGQTEPAPDDWGAIGVWSYGLGRALDYLEKDKDIDSKRVAIMGHSRLGKTVLWAGAMDRRFAMVLSSCSGEGGASLARRNYGETIRNLADAFPYWFCANFAKYADHADQLPVDMHELIALIAPRPVYVTGGETDRWADPKGEFLACVAAGPVYRLLGAQDLGTDQMPALDQPIMQTIAYHIHTGGHAVTAFDWDQFLTFADKHLRAH